MIVQRPSPKEKKKVVFSRSLIAGPSRPIPHSFIVHGLPYDMKVADLGWSNLSFLCNDFIAPAALRTVISNVLQFLLLSPQDRKLLQFVKQVDIESLRGPLTPIDQTRRRILKFYFQQLFFHKSNLEVCRQNRVGGGGGAEAPQILNFMDEFKFLDTNEIPMLSFEHATQLIQACAESLLQNPRYTVDSFVVAETMRLLSVLTGHLHIFVLGEPRFREDRNEAYAWKRVYTFFANKTQDLEDQAQFSKELLAQSFYIKAVRSLKPDFFNPSLQALLRIWSTNPVRVVFGVYNSKNQLQVLGLPDDILSSYPKPAKVPFGIDMAVVTQQEQLKEQDPVALDKFDSILKHKYYMANVMTQTLPASLKEILKTPGTALPASEQSFLESLSVL